MKVYTDAVLAADNLVDALNKFSKYAVFGDDYSTVQMVYKQAQLLRIMISGLQDVNVMSESRESNFADNAAFSFGGHFGNWSEYAIVDEDDE